MDLLQVCSNYVPRTKIGPRPGGHMFYIGLYRENMKKTLAETTMHRVLIFGMYHHLVDLYQVRSKYAPGAKNEMAPPRGSHVLHGLIKT